MLIYGPTYRRIQRRRRRNRLNRSKKMDDSKIILKLIELGDKKLITKQWKEWLKEGQITTSRKNLILIAITKFPHLLKHLPISYWYVLNRDEIKLLCINDPEYILNKKMENILTNPKYKKVVRAWFDACPGVIKKIDMDSVSLTGEDWFNLISRNKNIKAKHLPDNWVEEAEGQIIIKKISGAKTKHYSKKRLNEILSEREKEEDVGND